MRQTNLIYTGKLITTTKTKRQLTYNSGTINLFKLFSRILCIEEFNGDDLPCYLMLYSDVPSMILGKPTVMDQRGREILREYVPINSYVSETNNNFQSNFVSSVDSTYVRDKSKVYRDLTLALVDQKKQNILAVVEFDVDVYNTVRNGGQAGLHWILEVSNDKSEE